MAINFNDYAHIIISTSNATNTIKDESLSQIKDSNNVILWQKTSDSTYYTRWQTSNAESVSVSENIGATKNNIPIIDLVKVGSNNKVNLQIEIMYTVNFSHGTTQMYRADTGQ